MQSGISKAFAALLNPGAQGSPQSTTDTPIPEPQMKAVKLETAVPYADTGTGTGIAPCVIWHDPAGHGTLYNICHDLVGDPLLPAVARSCKECCLPRSMPALAAKLLISCTTQSQILPMTCSSPLEIYYCVPFALLDHSNFSPISRHKVCIIPPLSVVPVRADSVIVSQAWIQPKLL